MKNLSKIDAKNQGLKTYYTGIPCKAGHLSVRYTNCSTCSSCAKENASKRWASSEDVRDADTKRRRERWATDPDFRSRKLKSNYKWSESNKEKQIKAIKYWKKENKERVMKNLNSWRARKRKTDPVFLIKERLRSMIKRTCPVTSSNENIGFRIHKDVGYSCDDLVLHLERQFIKGMSWDNSSEWHIDHIVPLSVLVDTGITDPKIIHSLSNLRPMWAKENQEKGSSTEFLI